MNPFASILFCEKCGAVLKRNVPAKSQNTSPWYRCPTRGCNCRTMKCDFVEKAVVNAMREWLSEYTIKVETEQAPQADPTETALNLIRQQLLELQGQQDKICEYLEKGVYTVEMFSKRNETLTREICKLQKAEADIQKKQTVKNGEKKAVEELIPTTQRILDSYPHLSVEEKNSLWKIVLEKITVFRTPEGEFSLHLYPKLPR